MIVPLVVAAIFTFLPADQTVRLGVLLVLLCPCVDYVVVFSGDGLRESVSWTSSSECVVANRISFEVCGAGERSDRDAGVVVGMKKRAPW